MQIMVKTRGLGRTLDRAIRKALRRRDASDNDAPSGGSLLHQPVDSDSKSVLSRTLLGPRRKSSQKHLLKNLLLMLRIFQTDPMTHQFSKIFKITLLWEFEMERYVICKKHKHRSLLVNNFCTWSICWTSGLRYLKKGGLN